MKQMPFAWLVSGLFRVISTNYYKLFKDKRVDYSEVRPERNRPLEQIINEGSQGVVEKVRECYTEYPLTISITPENKAIKTQAEEDYEYLKVKLAQGAGLVVMTDDRYIGLIKLAFISEEVDKWLETLHGKLQFIFLDDVSNIGIVKC